MKHVMISSNHQRNFTLPRYQSIRWKHRIRFSVVEVLRLSKHSNRCCVFSNASKRGAVTKSHQYGAGLKTPLGSTSTPYRSSNKSAVMHLTICTGSRSILNGPNTMLGGTGGTTVASVNSRPLPSLVHFLNRVHGAFATPGAAICCKIVSAGYFAVRSTPAKVFPARMIMR